MLVNTQTMRLPDVVNLGVNDNGLDRLGGDLGDTHRAVRRLRSAQCRLALFSVGPLYLAVGGTISNSRATKAGRRSPGTLTNGQKAGIWSHRSITGRSTEGKCYAYTPD